MPNWKKLLKWFGWFIGFILVSADRMSRLIGKSTTPEDAESLLVKIGHFLDWITVQDSIWVLWIGIGLLAVSSTLIYADLRNWRRTIAPAGNTPSGDAALIGAQAELAKQNRLAEKGKRSSLAIDNSSPQIFPPTVTLHEPPPFKGENLYTGLINIDAGQLEERRAIEIAVRCFNGSGNAIFIQRVEGKITVNEIAGSSSKPIGDLPLPWLSDKAKQREIQPSEEFLVLLEQRVTEEIAGKIASIGPGLAIGFDLDGLNILIGSHFRPETLQRLPLWNGIRISRSAERLHFGRVIAMRLKAREYKFNPT